MSVLRGRNFLMAPGPTNVPDRVLSAMHRPAVELSTPEFVQITRSCMADLKLVFGTTGEILLFAANGHGAWEAALANTLRPGDLVLALEAGIFAQAWAEMAEKLGVSVETIGGDWRQSVPPEAIEERLRADSGGQIKAVLAVQTDTATGITSDVPAVRAAMDAASHDALLMVDAVASLATVEFSMDAWRVDVTVAAAQKALMTPPGLSFNAVGPRALECARRGAMPRMYWDWMERLDPSAFYKAFCGTPPEHLIFALREALDMLAEEGLEQAISRHRRLAECVHVAVDTWGQAGEVGFQARRQSERSNAVTSVRLEPPHDANSVREYCDERLNVSLGGGLGPLDGRVFRIGHMGDINEPMVLGALASVQVALSACRVPHDASALEAAASYLSG